MTLLDQTTPTIVQLPNGTCSFPKLSLLAVDARNGCRDIPFRKKCARGARSPAIFRSRGRAFFVHRTDLYCRCLCQRLLGHDRNAVEGSAAALQAPPPITL